MPARPNKPKLASGPKPYCTRNRVFLIAPLVAESLQKNPFPYDALASGRGVYAYVGNDPTDKVDPTGTVENDGGTKNATVTPNLSSRVGGKSTSGNYNNDGYHGTPQVTGTPGHDKASVNLAHEQIKEAQAAGRTVDSVHYNQAVGKATNGDLTGSERPDTIVRSTEPNGTKHIAIGEVTAEKSGQTVANQAAKLDRIAATAAPNVKVSIRATGFNALGRLLGIFGIGLAGYQLVTNPDYHAADALQDVSPIPIQGAY